MNNRWIYGLALVVFGYVALRGGLTAVRGRAWWARLLGVIALAMAVCSAALLVLFALNRPIPPLLHATALVGVLAVAAHQALRVAQTAPGASAILVGIYGALAYLMPRRPAPRRPADEADDEADEAAGPGSDDEEA